MSMQLSHNEHAFAIKKFPIILLTDNLMGDANIGSLFRLADAFNIEKLIFCGTPVNIHSNRLKRTARATVQNVQNEFWENSIEAIGCFKEKGYKSIALEITSNSVAVDAMKYNNEEKILLIVGNERHGVSDEILKLVDTKIHINMYGRNSSMNVSHATAIALYEISKTLPPFEEK